MKFLTRYSALLLIVILAAACSRNNVGDILPPYGKIDPEQQGWIKNDDGTYVLYSMEAGAVYSSQAPELLAIFPSSDATSVDLKTLILLQFSKTMALDADAIQIKPAEESNPAPIAGTWQFAPGSAGTVLVFEPDEDLEPETVYEIELTNTLNSAMGESFITDTESETQETTFQFTTGKADDKIEFDSVGNFTLPADQATDVFEGASVLVFFTEAVNTVSDTDGLKEAEEGDDNLTVKNQDNEAITGTRSFYFGDRLLVFEPDEPLPSGKRIDVTVAGRVKNSEGDETLGSDVTTSFTVMNVLRTTALAFPDSNPLIVRPSTLYLGMINLTTDRDAYKVDVTLEGSGSVSRITLIFWNGSDKAIIETNDGTFTARTHSFEVDLIPLEAEEASNENPLGATDNVVTVGAFTSRSGESTPLGPALELPLLRKDLEPPALSSLGPPNEADDGLALLSEMAALGIHGRASEDLSAVTITFEVSGLEQDPAEGIKFFSVEYPAASGTLSEEVTLGEDHLFLTEPLDLDTSGVFPGDGFDGPSMSRAEPPVEISQVMLTDLVGNTTTIDDPADATVDFRGYFLPATSGTAEIEVICSDAVTLRPIENADLVVENVSQGLVVEGVHTGATGTAEFSAFPSSILWSGNRMVLTAIKEGYQVVSIVWSYEYSFVPENKTLSLVLVPEQTVDQNTSLEITFENSTSEALPEQFVSGTDQVVPNGESLVSLGADPADGTVTVRSNMLQILQVLGIENDPVDAFQWAWLNPLIATGG